MVVKTDVRDLKPAVQNNIARCYVKRPVQRNGFRRDRQVVQVGRDRLPNVCYRKHLRVSAAVQQTRENEVRQNTKNLCADSHDCSLLAPNRTGQAIRFLGWGKSKARLSNENCAGLQAAAGDDAAVHVEQRALQLGGLGVDHMHAG